MTARTTWWVAGSAAAHAAVMAALLIRWPPPGGSPPPDPPSVEVVMVQQPAQVPGAAATTTKPTPPTPQDGEAPPRPVAAASVNLGGGERSDPWSVRSDDIRPPAPDARFRNLPPRYPGAAAARGETGTVELLIHVAPDGTADGADIVRSSGFPGLDGEARRAVLLWHFDPARLDGRAVPFDYPISIHFTRDNP